MRTSTKSAGRAAAIAVAVFLTLMIASNLAASAFWDSTDGLGLLDLDGGRNLLQPDAGIPLAAMHTGARTEALLRGFSDQAVRNHTLITVTLDVVFPLAFAVAGIAVTRWLASAVRPPQRAVLLLGTASSAAYALIDWLENAIELVLLHGGDRQLAGPLTLVSTVKSGLGTVVLAGIVLAPTSVALIRIVHSHRPHAATTGPRRRVPAEHIQPTNRATTLSGPQQGKTR